MRKHKIIKTAAIVATLATVTIAPLSISVANNLPNKKLNSINNSASNGRTITISVSEYSIAARKFIGSDSTTITWTDAEHPEDPEAESILSSIGSSAFANSALTTIKFPANVQKIGSLAFANCSDLATIDVSLIQDSLLSGQVELGKQCFLNVGSNKISESTAGFICKAPTSMNTNTFDLTLSYLKAMFINAGASSLQKILVKTNIAAEPYYTPNTQYTTIPVQYMNFNTNYEFTGFNPLALTTEKVEKYDALIFPYWMSGITDKGLEDLNKLKDSKKLKTIAFLSAPDASNPYFGITKFKDWFQGWEHIENVYLPSTVTEIEEEAFGNCGKLEYVDLSPLTLTSNELPYGLFRNAGKNGAGLRISFPNGIKKVGIDSIKGAKLQELTIPNTVTEIQDNAFFGCKTLKKLTIPASVQSIGKSAFEGCTNLSSIIYEDGNLKSIGANAFDGCNSLSGTFVLPSSLFESSTNASPIGNKAFATAGNGYETIDLSNISKDHVNNFIIDQGSQVFYGWPTKGIVKGASNWTTENWNHVMTQLQNGGLSTGWVKSSSLVSRILNVTYDEGTVLTINPGTLSYETVPDLWYSYDNNTWRQLKKNDSFTLDSQYRQLYLRGYNPNGFTVKNATSEQFSKLGTIAFTHSDSTKGVKIQGSVMGLLDNGTEDQSKQATAIPNEYCFYQLFMGSTAIQTVDANFLPSTNCPANAYRSMFNGCSNLTSAPNLSVKQLGERAYYNMFLNCAKLQTAPTLPATNLGKECYSNMFNGCSKLVKVEDFPDVCEIGEASFQDMFKNCESLVSAPELPDTKDDGDRQESEYVSRLNKLCYSGMFSGCTALTKAPKLPATKMPEECYKEMFLGCTSLVNAPTLNADNASSYGANCYRAMFQHCTALKQMEVKFRKTEWPAYEDQLVTLDWAKELTTGGKFICYQNLPHQSAQFNINQIPVGWTLDLREDPINPYSPTATHEAVGATCDKDTYFTLKNYGTNATTTKPNLMYKVTSPSGESGSWTDIYDENGKPKKVKINAGGKISFKGVNNKWSQAPSYGNTWTQNWSSLMFTNPECEGEEYASTGVHIAGNCMSLVLKAYGTGGAADTYIDDAEWQANPEYYKYCFYGLFQGPAAGDQVDGPNKTTYANENPWDHNYCIETIEPTFFSLPSLATGIFARCFPYCVNMSQSANIYSREAKNSRELKRFSFADAYIGCSGMVTGPEINLDCINSDTNAHWALHGAFKNCYNMETTSNLLFENISQCGKTSNSDGETFASIFENCYSLQNVHLYATKDSLSKQKWSNSFKEFMLNAGKYYWSGSDTEKAKFNNTTPKIYMDKDLYDWLLDQYTIIADINTLYAQGYSNTIFEGTILEYTLYYCGNLPLNFLNRWDVYNIADKSQKLN